MQELKIKSVNWISIDKPTEADIVELSQKFPQIHPIVLEDLVTPTIRSRVENYDHHLYMVLHFPNLQERQNKVVAQEIDFILMEDTMITVQYGPIDLIHRFRKRCESDSAFADRAGKSPIHLLYYLLLEFFALCLKELDRIQEEIDLIEEHAFSRQEKKILGSISLLKRNILDFRRAIKPQQLTLESLHIQATELYGAKTKPFLNDLVGEYLKVWSLLENHKETLDALYDTNHSLLAFRTNEIMRVFTILAFISFIPTVTANIYGMSIEHIPLLHHPYAFEIILGFMAVTTLLVYVVLKWRKLV